MSDDDKNSFIINDSDPSSLARDLNSMARSRAERRATADFESYLDFLEETSAIFGFKKKKKEPLEIKGDIPLL
jgi:hypothetical protein